MEKEIMYRIRGVTKDYLVGKKAMPALREINFDIRKNELVAILGTSGCGKSTLLRMLAGFLKSTTGAIYAQDKAITGPGADRGMVFQSYTLFPWLTVSKNIEYGLKQQGKPKAERQAIVERYLGLMHLESFGDSYPNQLSGGMKQRVAIARALATNPDMILMDEPFGALDPLTKAEMQQLIRNIWQQEKTTIAFVTHDIEEAVFLATKIYVMSARPGRVRKVIPVRLPYNRTQHLKGTPEFVELRMQINQMLNEN